MKYLIILVFLLSLAACSALQTPKVTPVHRYLLTATPLEAAPSRQPQVLAISLPTAAPGYDSPQMAYLRQPLELEYFARHRWADTPAQMLQSLLVQTLTPRFSAVVTTPGLLPADLRLDLELIKLHQDFTQHPSRIQWTLRAQLVAVKDKRVLAVRLFDETETADSEDAYGGVRAANRALQRILVDLAEFCLVTETKK